MPSVHSCRARRVSARALACTASLLAEAGVASAQQGNPSATQPGQDDFAKALDAELAKQSKAEQSAQPSIALPGGAQLKLLDLSLDVLASVGTSTEQNDSLSDLQLGDHDPNRRGFRLNQAELSAQGMVDPYFSGEAHIVYSIESDGGGTGVELEEAFLTTLALPWGLQLKGGQYFTEFGRINSTHPHAWDFVDQPVIMGRVFGGDGMRGPGARMSWLTPLPWFTEVTFGVQNADGEQMTSFLGNDETELPGGHVPVDRQLRSFADWMYSGRVLESWDLRDDVVMQLGFSGAFGPNASGSSTRTSIYGADLKVKWQPHTNDNGWPFVIWQTEGVHRTYGTQLQNVDPDGIPASGDEFTAPGDTLRDDGFYSYLLWGCQRDWIVGLRYEYATSHGDGATPRDDDPLRDDRTRISPLVIWQPTHFSRLSLQYNYDVADHLQHDDAHSIWLRVEFLFGQHPAHKY
jgi:hypothetical protein